MGITIISDSTAEISQAEARRDDVVIVPLKSIFGKEEYLDGVDISPEEFYQKLEEAEELPTTSQPSPFDFEQEFNRAQEAGNQIIVITIASELSGTLQSASIAREKCGGDIWIIDSGTATLGLRILVQKALSLRDEGKTAEEIVQVIEQEKGRVRMFAAIDTLEYLHKGGRLSGASALAGSLLKLKPIIALRQGEIEVVAKSRGSKKAQEEIFSLIEAAGGIDQSEQLAIGYTATRDRFDGFEQMCEAHSLGHRPIVSNIGSVIGTHAGPGAVAIAFFVRED